MEMGGIIAVIIIVIILLFIILWPFLRRQWPTQTLEEEVKEEIAEKTKGVTIIDASPKVPKHLPAYKCVICGTIVPKDQECPSCENN